MTFPPFPHAPPPHPTPPTPLQEGAIRSLGGGRPWESLFEDRLLEKQDSGAAEWGLEIGRLVLTGAEGIVRRCTS